EAPRRRLPPSRSLERQRSRPRGARSRRRVSRNRMVARAAPMGALDTKDKVRVGHVHTHANGGHLHPDRHSTTRADHHPNIRPRPSTAWTTRSSWASDWPEQPAGDQGAPLTSYARRELSVLDYDAELHIGALGGFGEVRRSYEGGLVVDHDALGVHARRLCLHVVAPSIAVYTWP